MPEHQAPLIATIAAGLMLAFVFGLIAQRLRDRRPHARTGARRERRELIFGPPPGCAGNTGCRALNGHLHAAAMPPHLKPKSR
jgi:hypothetical protein